MSTHRPLELVHMELYGQIQVQTSGGNRYVFVLVDDYSRMTWTLFLRSKDETFDVFTVSAKMVKKKLNYHLMSLRTEHGKEFENFLSS